MLKRNKLHVSVFYHFNSFHGGCLIEARNCLHFASTRVQPRLFVRVHVAHHFSFSVPYNLQLFEWDFMSYLCDLSVYIGVQHILCCVFFPSYCVLSAQCCKFLWIVPSVFSSVYIHPACYSNYLLKIDVCCIWILFIFCRYANTM